MDVTTNNTKSKVNIRLLVGTGMLSGLAFVLQYLEFPIPIMPFFIRFDFSDLPALIGAFAYGPLAGVIVEFIKNLLHCTVTQSFTALVMILFHERIIIGTFLLIVIVPALSVFCKSVLLSKLFKTIKVAN